MTPSLLLIFTRSYSSVSEKLDFVLFYNFQLFFTIS